MASGSRRALLGAGAGLDGGAGSCQPVSPQLLHVDPVGLVRSRRQHGPPLEVVHRRCVGVGAVVLGRPPLDEVGQLRVDLPGPLREQLEEVVGHADDLGLPGTVRYGLPGDAEPVGQLGAEGGVVDPAGGTLLAEEPAGVEGEPLAGGVLDLRPDHGVGVQLRVQRPGGVLTEHRDRETSGVDLVDAVGPVPCHVPVPLDPGERRLHGGVVSGEDLPLHGRVVGQGPQHRHRLGRRERGVVAPRRLGPVPAPHLVPAARVPGLEHEFELRTVDLAREAGGGDAPTPPATRRLVGIGVVGGGAGVVAGDGPDPGHRCVQHRDPHHAGTPGGANATVCAPTTTRGRAAAEMSRALAYFCAVGAQRRRFPAARSASTCL